MSNKENIKYEYTRAIRQNLIGGEIEKLKSFVKSNDKSDSENLKDFLENYDLLISSFEEAFFFENKNNDLKTFKSVQIKLEWVRSFAREVLYTKDENQKTLREKNRTKKYEASNFHEILFGWRERNKGYYSKLKDHIKKIEDPKEELSRLSDIGLIVGEIRGKDNFSFVEKLAEEGMVGDKNSDEKIEIFRDRFVAFSEVFYQVSLILAPNLNNGVEISRASFNYYTVNRLFANEDFDKRLKETKSKFSKTYYLNDKDREFLDKVGFKLDIQKIFIEELYKELKEWKAKQKKYFSEAVAKGDSLNNLKENFPIFSNHKALDSYLKQTKEITRLSNQFNQNKDNRLKKELDIKKKKRGELFMKSWGFSDWVEYCDIFKKVAITLGKLKAEKRGIERDKIEARLLQYWSLMVKNGDNYELLLVPCTKMLAVKNEIESLKNISNSEKQLVVFESITLRALEKLIRKNLEKEVEDLGDDQKAISLYKKVLRGDYSSKINLETQAEVINKIKDSGIFSKSFSNIESFRIALEEKSYLLKTYSVSENILSKWREEFGVIISKLSTYDQERDLASKPKAHTVLWSNFWSEANQNNLTLRLNPEVRIFFRPKREQKEQEKQNNRFSEEQFKVAFTITENAGQKKIENAFQEEKEQTKMIEKFNQEISETFVRGLGDGLWYYGIDRGQQELASLCVVKFSQEEYEATLKDGRVKKFKVPIQAKIKLWKIKDDCLLKTKKIVNNKSGRETEIICWKNPSYFLEDDIFEEIESPSIDLTMAKLIKDKIILNGDLATYLALKRANGKRQLFNKFADIDSNAQIIFEENQFKVKSNKEKLAFVLLPYWNESLSKIISAEEFRVELQEYLDDLRANKTGEDSTSIEQINHLRDAITANMVGIISHVFDEFPGIINLENLHSNREIKSHFEASNDNISRRLEWSLYKKFQKRGLVPPKLKNTIFQKEENKVANFGVIHFVPTEKTSANCPFCEEHTSMEQRKKDKFEHHTYICRGNEDNCGFRADNPKSPLEFIDNSDTVASYNIAKLGLKEEK